MDNEPDELLNRIDTLQNLLDLVCLVEMYGRLSLLPTILEITYEKIQDLIDEYCVEGV